MLWKMRATIALSLAFIAALSEGFFIPTTVRKQGPNASGFGNQQWISSQVSTSSSTSGANNNNNNNNVQPNYNSVKDYAPYQQQQFQQHLQSHPQQQQQAQQQPQQQQQQQQIYSTQQLQNSHLTGPKYEAVPYHTVGQPQYGYDNVYSGSYPPTVQLVPCLCPVNKEVIEQQNQQLQQQQSSALPASPETNASAAAAQPLQPTQKKTS